MCLVMKPWSGSFGGKKMFETDEEQEMLYTLSVNLEYFARETERGSKWMD